eukprot:g1010.t1
MTVKVESAMETLDVKKEVKDEEAFFNGTTYGFATFSEEECKILKRSLEDMCIANELKGFIYVSVEGVNIFLSGRKADDILEIIDWIVTKYPTLSILHERLKWSSSSEHSFNRMYVSIKKEIIALGDDTVDPLRLTGKNLKPEAFKEWLDSGKDITILDTRNDYEYNLGTFNSAVKLDGLKKFRDFPEYVKSNSSLNTEEVKEKPLVMFCTGGIRCEKASNVLMKQGFKNVYQLEGGVLRYFEKCRGAHWEGDLFVFDKRVSLSPNLLKSEKHTLCFRCRQPLNEHDIQHEQYEEGVSCPYCYGKRKQQKAATKVSGKKKEKKLSSNNVSNLPVDRRTCTNCAEVFVSRSALFKHIPVCPKLP